MKLWGHNYFQRFVSSLIKLDAVSARNRAISSAVENVKSNAKAVLDGVTFVNFIKKENLRSE